MEKKAFLLEKKPCLIISLIVTAIFTFQQLGYGQERKKGNYEVLAVQKDVKIINLLNSLELRRKQMEYILGKAKEAKRINDYAEGRTKELSNDMASVTEDIKNEVGKGKVRIERRTAREFREIKAEIKNIQREASEKVELLASRIEGELEEHQLIALDDYRPCIIPIAKNGRIGQANSGTRFAKTLERVRNIPNKKYNEQKNEIASRLIEIIKSHQPPNVKIDEWDVRMEILNAFSKVRRMDDAEFKLKKELVVQELTDTIGPKRPGLSRTDKIKQFLLSENIIPILEKRL